MQKRLTRIQQQINTESEFLKRGLYSPRYYFYLFFIRVNLFLTPDKFQHFLSISNYCHTGYHYGTKSRS